MANEKETGTQVQVLEMLRLAAARAERYVRAAPVRRVGPSEAAVSALAEFHEAFPESSCDPSNVIERLDEIGSAATVATTGGRYFGFVNGGMVPARLAAHWLAATGKPNAA